MKRSMPVVLDVNGAILLSVGASMIYMPAGVILAGILSFAINWRLHGD